MAEEPQELQANLAEYREQLQQVCSPRSCLFGYMLRYSSQSSGQGQPDSVVRCVQLEELLLDEPDNQDYQSLYNDVQEVRPRPSMQGMLPVARYGLRFVSWPHLAGSLNLCASPSAQCINPQNSFIHNACSVDT